MADVFSKRQRSEVMRAVRSNGNKSTELRLIDYFKKSRVTGWRRNYRLIGKPDFVFPQKRVAVFVDGCFWHGHKCRNTTPVNNAEYWHTKVARNKKRDKFVSLILAREGWQVFRIWECKLKKNAFPKGFDGLARTRAQQLKRPSLLKTPTGSVLDSRFRVCST